MRFLLITGQTRGPSEAHAIFDILRHQQLPAYVLSPAHPLFPLKSRPWGISLAKQTLTRSIGTKTLAFVEASIRTVAAGQILAAIGVPYIWYISKSSKNGQGQSSMKSSLIRELKREAFRWTTARAHQVWVDDLGSSRWIARELGQMDSHVMFSGLDLNQLPQGDRAEAQSALGLSSAIQWISWIGPLSEDLILQTLAMTHRKLAGVGLLVVGDGPLRPMIDAMASSTRPSSPVVHIGPETPATTLATACATDIGLSLSTTALPKIAWTYAALGRRQVLTAAPGAHLIDDLYPEHESAFETQPTADSLKDAIHQALEEERRQGQLPEEAVTSTREQLDQRLHYNRLAQELIACASSL